jgi:hypothetical protein
LNSTRVASSYLIKPTVINDTPPNPAAPFTRASRLHSKNKDVIPTFIPSPLPPLPPPPPPSSVASAASATAGVGATGIVPIPSSTSSHSQQHSYCYQFKDFQLNCFECEVKGRIDLTLPADASNILNNSLSHQHTVTMLESTALHPFLISNLRKCFVYQHKNGDIYYMAFALPKDDKDRLVSLLVYGVTELNLQIQIELKKVLEVKLTEYIANIISMTMVPRRTVLPTTHVQFIRDCGLSKRVEFVYHLPSSVTDPYFFCILAKQLFSKSEIFMALTIQYTDRQQHLSSSLHPVMYGYDNSHQMTEMTLGQQIHHEINDQTTTTSSSSSSSSLTEKMNHENILRPYLERKKRVEEELCSEHTIHPIFFDRKRQLQTPRNDRRNDSSLTVWDQGDFTLLYNSQEKEKSKRNIAQKRAAFTQSGGLALIEFEPLSEYDLFYSSHTHMIQQPLHDSTTTSIPLSTVKHIHSRTISTGSEESLINDVNHLIHHLKYSQNILFESAKLFEMPTILPNENTLSHVTDRLVVRIYPTRGINPKTLMEGLHTFFHQTLIYYSLERLFAVYNNPNISYQRLFTPHLIHIHESNTTATPPTSGNVDMTTIGNLSSLTSMKQDVTPYSNSQIATDLFNSYHKLILHNSSDLLPYISHLNIQTRFSLTDAESLYHRILSSIISQFPHLVNYTILPIHHQHINQQANWLDSQERFQRDDQTMKTTSTTSNATNTSNIPSTKYSTCSCILGENFLTIEGKRHPKDFYKWNGSARDGQFLYVTSATDFPYYSLETVNGLRHIPDYVPIDKSLLFPLWLRKRRYAIEVTLTSCGIDVYFFNIEKKHIDNIKTMVQEYSKEMFEINLQKQFHYLKTMNFTRMISQTMLRQSTAPIVPTSSSNSSSVGISSTTSLVSIEYQEEERIVGLREKLIQRLNIQIQGLFWSQRVLSRLYLFTSNGLVTTPSGNLGTNLKIQNELKDIPYCLWNEGILLKREYVPLPFYQKQFEPTPPTTNHEMVNDNSRTRTRARTGTSTSIGVVNFIEDYHQHLSHLLRSFDCYLLQDSESSNLSIVLPIPHTSSLYIIQLTSFYSLYLGISYRVTDCVDIIHSIAHFYDLDDPNSLLSQITCDHLECYPSIGSPSKEEREQEGEWNGEHDKQESRLNVMDLIYNNSVIAQLNKTVLYAMLSTLYFQSYGNDNETKGNGTRILATLK